MTKKITILGLLWIAMTLTACYPQPPRLIERGSQEPTENTICQRVQKPVKYEREKYWVKDQLLLTGDEKEIDNLLAQMKDEVTFTLLERCNLSRFQPANERFDALLKKFFNRVPTGAQREQLVSNLYDVHGQLGIVEIIRKINELRGEAFVFAGPNYLVGPSPHTVGNGPFGEPGPVTNFSVVTQFRQQWAFREMARDLPLSSVLGTNTGENIRVGIFDTSPLVSLLPVGMVNAHVLVTWSQPTSLTFTLSHPAIYPIAGAPATLGGAEHGFFVAGLIHGLSPNSQLSLIRVLNDDGLGALSDLRRELYNFIWTNLDEKGRLDRVIINLSLGVHQPTSDLEDLEETIDLFLPLADAYTRGALVVAAAGNDSGVSMAPQDRPALYPFVLGVAATTPNDTRACYSNPGDVAAPGGDGGNDGVHACAPIAKLVCSDVNCPNGLMSIVTGTTAPLTGYAYWAGTSFATPLVSALAALAWAGDPGLTADDITTMISSRAVPVGDPNLGAGVSNAACILLPPASQPGECPP